MLFVLDLEAWEGGMKGFFTGDFMSVQIDGWDELIE